MSIAAAIAAATLAAGCSVDSNVLQTAIVMGSQYDPLPCPEIVQRYKSYQARMKDLTTLMEKSGSAIANALAYDSEYASVRASSRYAKEAAERKGCDIDGKGPPKPPEATPPPAQAPEVPPINAPRPGR